MVAEFSTLLSVTSALCYSKCEEDRLPRLDELGDGEEGPKN